MIIKKLVLHNFGVYAGTNIFEFHPDQPVVLIGGMNGRGKTTFLEAVLLALYGSSSFAYTESNYTSYTQYLKSYVNKSDGTNHSYIELEFQLEKCDSEYYTVRREWDGVGYRSNEKLSASKNGVDNPFLSQNWSMFIENILPSGLSNFFFFDGEKIAALAVESTSAQMKDSIKSLLGITVIDQLESDLSRVISKVKRKSEAVAEDQKLEELREKKDQALENLALLDDQITALKAEIDEKGQSIEKKKVEYSTRGGEVVSKKQEMFQQRAELVSQLDTLEENLHVAAGGLLPLALVQNLLWSIKTQSDLDQKTHLQHLACQQVLEMYEEYQRIQPMMAQGAVHFVHYMTDQSSGEYKPVYSLSDAAIYQARELTRFQIDQEIFSTTENLKTRSSLQKKIDEIDHYLSVDIDEKGLAKLFDEIQALEKNLIELQVQLEHMQASRAERNGEAIRAASAYNRFVESYLERLEISDDGDRILKYAYQSQRILTQYKLKLQERKIDILADTMTACYKRLADKKSLIERVSMDPVTLDLRYLNSNGDIVPTYSLSAGEKQLMVISLLWALGICSRKKLPVIIDTPLSRLDSNHRSALIQTYFPNASDQTIILSTDSEVDRNYYLMMKPNLSDEYTLVYDEQTKSSSIRQGYFPEVMQ